MMGNFYLGNISKCKWLMLFLLVTVIDCDKHKNGYIRTIIKSKDTNGIVEYIAELWIGSPRKQFFCNIDFSHGQLIMFKSLSSWSKSYSIDKGIPTEIVEISNRIFRVRITYPTNPDDFILCETCSCVLGLGKDSFAWTIWSGATFSRSSIEFGSVNKFLKNNDPICNHILIKCEDTNSPHICSTKNAVISGTRFDSIETNIGTDVAPQKLNSSYSFFLSTNGYSTLPREIYNLFFDGHNVYKELPIIKITFKHDYVPPQDVLVYTNIRTVDCPENSSIVLEEKRLILKQGFGKIRSQILPSEDTNIILGVYTWMNFIVYYDNIYNFVVLEAASSSISYDFTVVFLSLILFIILIRAKLANCCVLFETETETDFYYIANVISQLLGIFLSFFVFVLNHARYLFNLNLLNFVTFIFYVVLYSLSVLIQLYFMIDSSFKKANGEAYHPFSRYIYSLWNQFQHEFIIETGLWILLTETNTEEFDNFFTFLIQILIIYTVVRFAFFAITTPFFLKRNFSISYLSEFNYYSFQMISTIILSVLLSIILSVLAWIVFFNPFLTIPAEHVEVNVNLLTFCLMISIILVVLYFSLTRIIKSTVRNIRDEKIRLIQSGKKDS